MTNISLRKLLKWVLRANVIVWGMNALIFAVLGLMGYSWVHVVFSGYFSKMTFVETGVSFLVAGAMAFSGSILPSKVKEQILKSDEDWSIDKLKKGEKRANNYIILAAILLVESLLLSLFGA